MPLADHSTPGPLADHSTPGLLTVSPGLLTVSSLPRFGSTPAGKAAGAEGKEVVEARQVDVEEGEVESGDADIPDSVARALLDALQEKRQGHQLPAAMAPLARVRAS